MTIKDADQVRFETLLDRPVWMGWTKEEREFVEAHQAKMKTVNESITTPVEERRVDFGGRQLV